MKQKILFLIGLALLLVGCSTTKHLSQGELLYIGQKKMIIENPSNTAVGELAMIEIEAALEKAPNSSFLGSSTKRIPFPVGLWIYNGFVKYEKGFGKWIFNRFAATPVYLSTVNPEIRAKAASNLLHDYGYFDGTVNYKTFIDNKDSLKAKIQYTVDMKSPYDIDTVYYERFNPEMRQLMERGRRLSLITPGQQFNVNNLDEERTRVSTLLRNRGYYYFRPTYLTYQADTTLVNGEHISLKLIPIKGLPAAAQRPYFLGNLSVYLYGKGGEQPNDSITYKDMDVHFYNKLQVRPNMLYRWLHYQYYVRSSAARVNTPVGLYNQNRHTRIQERLSQLNIFRYMDMQYVARDTTNVSDTLDMKVQATFDKPLDAELELNVTTKSNDQMGPGASFSVTRNNVFGGGETWNVKLKGSYEWQTSGNGNSLMNSWEMGLSTALTFPRVVFPTFGGREYNFRATTTLRLYIDQLNRAKYYQLLSFGGNTSYDFQPTRTSKHSLTPFRLTFNVLRNQSEAFQQVITQNPALYVSMRNQFIPAMEYTYTYDNASLRQVRNPIWWQTTVTSAGNVTSVIYRILGQPLDKKEKSLLGAPFAQFLKLNTQLRYLWKIDKNQSIAARVAGGIIYSYGNATVAPYSEQFYVGGANSVRAFTVRSIGPGGYQPNKDRYSFIDQTGDIRMEANIEYRPRLVGHLYGAIFLDAGNVWLLRKDNDRPDSQLKLSSFLNQVALGTGVGLRYDLDYLILRLDCGIGLHAPYATQKKGYYNIPTFGNSLGVHFAIGYPF